MRFVLKLVLRELKRNKAKVLMSFFIVMILYMSAFTLCNVASALPYNFYRYYEQYKPEIIGMTVSDTDAELYNRRDEYFVDTDVDWDFVFDRYYIESLDGRLRYDSFETDEAGNKNEIYESDLLDAESNRYNPEVLNKFIIGMPIGAGEGIWLAKTACEALEVDISAIERGEDVYVNFAVTDSAENPFMTKVRINGVVDEQGLVSYIEKNEGRLDYPRLVLMNIVQASGIVLNSDLTFSMYGTIAKVDVMYQVYYRLSQKYTVDASITLDMVNKVKDGEIICGIIGACMLLGGLVILLNFVNMFISTNIKHIALLRMLGTKTKYITLAYYLIFILIITAVCLISWAFLPLYNMIVEYYCSSIGYPFSISINYGLVSGLFLVSYALITLIMVVKHYVLRSTSPNEILLVED